MNAVMRKGLAMQRLEVAKDSVEGERRRRLKDETYAGVSG
jgi:hypothetical protein